jgi:hypothetical protein
METKYVTIIVMKVVLLNPPYFLFQNDFDGEGWIAEDKDICNYPVKLIF